ncbi:MAG: hypothetical protein AB7G11_17125, partial [Phycisphaerales bacterium]
MKHVHAWHKTAVGSVVCWLGGIRFAVPVLAFVAVALAWGTYIESTESGKAARAAVYGSWWFIGLMALVCVSLIFAVITRYPWKRKHIGFIVVHASLVALIGAGFWSLFGRIEGRIMLREGMSSNAVETEQEVIELVRHNAGTFEVLGQVVAEKPGTYTLGGMSIRLVEHWSNTREEFEITNDNASAFRAVEVSLRGESGSGTGIGEDTGSGPGVIEGLTVEVLAPGNAWDAPAPATR